MNTNDHFYYFKMAQLNGKPVLIEVEKAEVEAGKFSHVYETDEPLPIMNVDLACTVNNEIVFIGTDSEVRVIQKAFINAGINAGMSGDIDGYALRFCHYSKRRNPTEPPPLPDLSQYTTSG